MTCIMISKLTYQRSRDHASSVAEEQSLFIAKSEDHGTASSRPASHILFSLFSETAKPSQYTEMDIDKDSYTKLIILILQFLDEENYKESLHLLEQESKIFFNVNYFGETIVNGEWEKAEEYLSSFTKLNDNRYSMKLFFEIRKQKYYEASVRNDQAEDVNVLWPDLKFFLDFQDENYEELADLIDLKNFRDNEHLSRNVNKESARAISWGDLKSLVEQNPTLQDKLIFPRLNQSGLLSIITLICPNPGKKTSIKEELIYLILQFLDEENLKGTCHKLEQESKIFFNMNYFGEFVISGEWDKAVKYLSAFTMPDDNQHSAKIFFTLEKQKYLANLGRNDQVQAIKILPNDLQDNFLYEYMDAASLRANLCDVLKESVKSNPILQDKLKFPAMDKSRLLTILKKIMDWWIPHCANSTTDLYKRNISLVNIPKVPYLCREPMIVVNSHCQEASALPGPNGLVFHDSSCCNDVSLQAGMKSSEKYGSRDNAYLADANSGVYGKSTGKLAEINDPSECQTLVLPDTSLTGGVTRLMYSCSGDFILALTQNATHKLWRWYCDDQHSSSKATANVEPQLYQPSSGLIMTNEIGTQPENALSCFSLKDPYLFSASGGKISIFNLETFERLSTFGSPPPSTTYFTFLMQNIFAIGLDDSILIRCFDSKKTIAHLKGHQKRITCLAFSQNLNVLVSSGADAQLCVWSTNGWEKLASKFLLSKGEMLECPVVNHIEFHQDQIHLLAVHERNIHIYEAPTLNHSMQWVPQESDLPITYATYSCDGQSIFVSFKNGCIKVLVAATLYLRCRINVTAYIPPGLSSEVYPIVIAAHPFQPNNIALGLTDGRVHVLEPLESEGEWGISPQPKDGEGLSTASCSAVL
ncbi:topless-related protein 4 isoform X2 [Quercus robur]|uniref:topless-related protein 4 isoform X2 n=1 Tax=Quercus robur TaxID=38942 RepID=UPI0021610C41|nr:topless-related protein 4 isoform X2 [Quercus robur]